MTHPVEMYFLFQINKAYLKKYVIIQSGPFKAPIIAYVFRKHFVY